ncbi:hypothetical protein [Actinoplanes siamensis]|uniref:hypothetical protein n=1 Tax=Actinoplanes siamensis TaxID=1223317 RepID=UPI001944F0EC|nr:hypothetical protein [Actinoplanes siamensis]
MQDLLDADRVLTDLRTVVVEVLGDSNDPLLTALSDIDDAADLASAIDLVTTAAGSLPDDKVRFGTLSS